MMDRCSRGLVAVILFIVLVSSASPASCRSQPIDAGGNLTYASTNATAANSATLLEESKDCELVFCTKRSCNGLGSCYCCEPNPDKSSPCFSTRNQCLANCPVCKPKRSQ
ncbi:hypothetical protein EJB05_46188 [Eragrostis curvula]|uniref:Embryo surrounding factor 1 brassicaceae domain-containing protein n=1 Tax=Eragrostis curvula TaxID=38414 RepID=A0A5J9TMU2_9POAL|nr:hypothetical protein EJB05_46188 [Eragrostis curvula]